MQTDIGALQALPQAEYEALPWPCTVSDFEDPDDDDD
jgi:hypothetical protein